MFGKQKNLDTEVDLIAFISLLAILICTLLLTSVWVHMGSLNVKQAVGSGKASGKKPPTLWVQMNRRGTLSVEVRQAQKLPKTLRKSIIRGLKEGKPNTEKLSFHLQKVKKYLPKLEMGFVKPHKDTAYEDMISVMDHFKKEGLLDIGVVPL